MDTHVNWCIRLLKTPKFTEKLLAKAFEICTIHRTLYSVNRKRILLCRNRISDSERQL